MKKVIYIIFMFVVVSKVNSQFVYDSAYLDTNNWRAYFTPTNSVFWNLPICMSKTYIGGSNAIFTMNFWIGGYDDAGNLHVSADRYYNDDETFLPGPYGFLPNSVPYNKIWKITKEQIDYHIAHWDDPGYQMPEVIATWPAHGDVNNGEEYILAPFVDMNQNGVYDPENGDYPFIYGDEALFYIISDRWGNALSGAQKFGVEVRVMAFAFNTGDTVIDNTFFIHYDILNKSGNNYHDVRFALNVDFDIGYAYDDYIGCDTSLNCFFGYNGDEDDSEPYSDRGYGLKPPAAGVVFLSREMTSFMYYGNGSGAMGDPVTGTEYYMAMNSIWKDGTHLVAHGNGHDLDSSATDTCMFAFPENSGWTEYEVGSVPYDRRGVATLSLDELDSNSCLSIDFAFTWARDTVNYVDIHTPVERLLAQIPHIVDFVNNLDIDTNCSYLATSVPYMSYNGFTFNIYPNPAQDVVRVITNKKHYELFVYNELGMLVYEGEDIKDFDVSAWKSGLYVVVVRSGNDEVRKKLIVYK